MHTKENTDERKEKEMKNAAVVLKSIGEECSGRGLCFKHAVSASNNVTKELTKELTKDLSSTSSSVEVHAECVCSTSYFGAACEHTSCPGDGT